MGMSKYATSSKKAEQVKESEWKFVEDERIGVLEDGTEICVGHQTKNGEEFSKYVYIRPVYTDRDGLKRYGKGAQKLALDTLPELVSMLTKFIEE